MKKIDLGQTVSVLANLGVIVGIVFLAFEIRQNNDLLASQARANLTASRVALQQSVVENAGGIADVVVKASNGETLSDVEAHRLRVSRSMNLNNFASMYQEVLTGPLSEEDLPVLQWRAVFRGDREMRGFWERAKDAHNPDFVRFIDEQIIPFATQ